jgi:hypothetical protein
MIQTKKSRYKDQNEWFVDDMDPRKECQFATVINRNCQYESSENVINVSWQDTYLEIKED